MADAGYILGIDTALGETSLALFSKGRGVCATFHDAERNTQASYLVPRIEALLTQAGITYGELSALAVSIGPGGFTGIRIGLATARAIGYATGADVLGYSTLHLLAHGHKEMGEGAMATLLPAGRGQVFFQRFDALANALVNPTVLEQDIVGMHLHPGDRVISTTEWSGLAALPHSVKENARFLCELAGAHCPPDGDTPPVPLYIKPADAKRQQPFLESLGSIVGH